MVPNENFTILDTAAREMPSFTVPEKECPRTCYAQDYNVLRLRLPKISLT
jgi:hypothetical protein